MNDFLTTYLSEIDRGRVQAIMSIINDARANGEIRTSQEFQNYFDKLSKEVLNKPWIPAFNPLRITPEDNPVITSQYFNDTMQSIYMDLAGLYKHQVRLGQTIVGHNRVKSSEMIGIRTKIRKLMEDAAVYTFLKSNKEWDDVKYNTFASPRNLSKHPSKVRVDEKTARAELPKHASTSIAGISGKFKPKITITPLVETESSGTYGQIKPSNIIDSIRDNFWLDMYMYNSPVKSKYNNTEYNGLILEVLIEFNGQRRFNKLELEPFGLHPMDIIAIKVSDDGSSFSDWSGYVADDPSTDWLCYNSRETDAQAIKIYILQQNYFKRRYLLERSLVDNVKFWEHILDSEVAYLTNTVTTPTDARLKETMHTYNTFLDAKRQLDNHNTDHDLVHGDYIPSYAFKTRTKSKLEIMMDSNSGTLEATMPGSNESEVKRSDMVEISRYEYAVGIRHINVLHNMHNSYAEYKSPKYKLKGRPCAIRLETEETHQYFPDKEETTVFDENVNLTESGSPAYLAITDNWHLEGVDLGIDTDANNKIYARVDNISLPASISLYKSSGYGLVNKIAYGALPTWAPSGTVSLGAVNSSGVSGTVDLDVSGFLGYAYITLNLEEPTEFYVPGTSIQYSIELDQGNSLPIMPYGTQRIYGEIVPISQDTLTGKTRFYPNFSDHDGTTATQDAAPEVYLYGKKLVEDTDYTFDWKGNITIKDVLAQVYKPRQIAVSYGVGQYNYTTDAPSDDVVRAEALYNDLDVDKLVSSTRMDKPLEFDGTDDNGSIDLPYYPSVHKQIVASAYEKNPIWIHDDNYPGRWALRPQEGAQEVDGRWYGNGLAYASDDENSYWAPLDAW